MIPFVCRASQTVTVFSFYIIVFRRHDAILEEEQPIIREVASYVATRKKFAVEDDDVMQKLKNQKYQLEDFAVHEFNTIDY